MSPAEKYDKAFNGWEPDEVYGAQAVSKRLRTVKDSTASTTASLVRWRITSQLGWGMRERATA